MAVGRKIMLFQSMCVFAAFIFTIFLLMAYLSKSESTIACDCVQQTQSNSLKQSIQEFSAPVAEYLEEIESLKQQIKTLQLELSEQRINSSKLQIGVLPKCCQEVLQIDKKIQKTEIFQGITYPSENYIEPFNRFDLWRKYPALKGYEGKVVEKINGILRIEIDEVIDWSVNYLNTNGSKQYWRRDHFTEGLYRTINSIGTHYETYFFNGSILEKVSLFRPHGPPIALHHRLPFKASKINIIIPLYGRLAALKLYLDNFLTVISKRNNVHLTIIYFGDTYKEFIAMFQPFVMKHGYHRYTIKHVADRNFSRGYGLDIGVRAWSRRDNPLIFLCDVDVIFNSEFLSKCEVNAQPRQQVYYPIVFSLYNPQVIEQFYGQKIPSWKNMLKISSDVGFWRDFGFGMACMYRSDYLESGGFSGDVSGWGTEDVLLYRKFAQSNLTIVRAPDPDIFHLWHHKACDSELSDEQYRSCLRTKALNEGSHVQLGYIAFKNEIERRRKRFEHL